MNKKIPKFLKNINKNKKSLIMAKNTKKITRDDIVIDSFAMLKENYDYINENELYDPLDRALLSLINCVITQKRVFLGITKKSWQNLVRNDENYIYKPGKGFGSDSYGSVIAYAIDNGMFKIIKKDNDKTPMGIEIIYEDLLEYLVIDKELQRQELLDFIDKNTLDIDELVVAPPVSTVDNTQTPVVESGPSKISFQQFLDKEYAGEQKLMYNLLDDMIESAATTCHDFEDDSEIILTNILVKHFFSHWTKKTKKAKEYEEGIREKFTKKLRQHFASSLETIEPTKKIIADPLDEHSNIRIKQIIARYKARKSKESK